MRILTEKEFFIALTKFMGFIEENNGYFDDVSRKRFLEYYRAAILGEAPPGYIAQILSATGIEEMLEEDYWGKHRRAIETGFELDRGKIVIEPGAGVLPILSTQLKKLHPSSTFVPIDPKIHESWARKHGVIPKKKKFQYSFCDIPQPDIVLGVYPCDATDDIVGYIKEHERVELYLAMCDCNPLLQEGKTYDEYAQQVISRIRYFKGDDRCMDVEYDDRTEEKTPIVKLRALRKYRQMPFKHLKD